MKTKNKQIVNSNCIL